MKSEKQFNEEREITRNGLVTLLKREFAGLAAHANYIERGRKEKVFYLGRELKYSDLVYAKMILNVMEGRNYFSEEELRQYKRKYSELQDRIIKAKSKGGSS